MLYLLFICFYYCVIIYFPSFNKHSFWISLNQKGAFFSQYFVYFLYKIIKLKHDLNLAVLIENVQTQRVDIGVWNICLYFQYAYLFCQIQLNNNIACYAIKPEFLNTNLYQGTEKPVTRQMKGTSQNIISCDINLL